MYSLYINLHPFKWICTRIPYRPKLDLRGLCVSTRMEAEKEIVEERLLKEQEEVGLTPWALALIDSH